MTRCYFLSPLQGLTVFLFARKIMQPFVKIFNTAFANDI